MKVLLIVLHYVVVPIFLIVYTLIYFNELSVCTKRINFTVSFFCFFGIENSSFWYNCFLKKKNPIDLLCTIAFLLIEILNHSSECKRSHHDIPSLLSKIVFYFLLFSNGFTFAIIFILFCGGMCYFISFIIRNRRRVFGRNIEEPTHTNLNEEEINQLETYEYERKDLEEICCICIAPLENTEIVLKLPICSHIYHSDCIKSWLRVSETCPFCRLPARIE